MKSIEELIDDIIELAKEGVLYTPDYFKDKYKMDEQLNQSKDNKAEILRRVEELEKELLKHTKAFSTLWNCYKELDKERISLSIQVSQAEEQVERLKCCGNCKHSDTDWNKKVVCCLVEEKETKSYKYCDNWTSDGLKRSER
jgi:chromosome segregation ATPase